MYIDQITLNNFRGYYGENTVQFSTDNTKNISIVAGNNGFGKTTLLTALIWGLYGKLMGDVDEIYRNEINQAGGYKRYCRQILNKLVSDLPTINSAKIYKDKRFIEQIADEQHSFSTKILFSQLTIPHLPCEKVEIIRTYQHKTDVEKLEILIDGKPNELTKNVGSEFFINGFILPKEIAKFFFFDAEKIVSMAEIKTTEQKRYFSEAYAEVLGIKKYTDLKDNLKNLQLRLRKKSAAKNDRDRLIQLTKQTEQNEKLEALFNQQIEEKQEILRAKKLTSDKYQEQLIREGSSLTLDELKRLKEDQIITGNELNTIKLRFNDMLSLAPFAMLMPKMELVKQQLEDEANNSSIAVSLLESKFHDITHAIQLNRESLSLLPLNEQALLDTIKKVLLHKQKSNFRPLLDFTIEQQNGLIAIYDTLKNSYRENFKLLVADQKRMQSKYNNLQKRLKDGESKEKDPVIAHLRSLKQNLDKEISQLENELDHLNAKISSIGTETATLSRQISELSKRISVENADLQKDQTTARIIDKLDKFIYQLKASKKQSLEANLRQAFNQLMHKKDFIKKINVILEGESIDIELIDYNGLIIKKESLSKGEQQLYATALLKALIEESNISFPVFIDSPLQKFDKFHSKNIITDFYPNLSNQVVLLPLLQKELSENEYDLLLPFVGKTYTIRQSHMYKSDFHEAKPLELFDFYKSHFQNV